MIDSTNPRIMADNIEELFSMIKAISSFSTSETDTGITWGGNKVYSKLIQTTAPTVETAGTSVKKSVDVPSGTLVKLLLASIYNDSYQANLPFIDSSGNYVRAYQTIPVNHITIDATSTLFSGASVDLVVFYVKPSAAALTLNNNLRSTEDEILVEEKPIEEEVTVKKTTRKK